eukprot:5225190-Prymnesium_polylepis.1
MRQGATWTAGLAAACACAADNGGDSLRQSGKSPMTSNSPFPAPLLTLITKRRWIWGGLRGADHDGHVLNFRHSAQRLMEFVSS